MSKPNLEFLNKVSHTSKCQKVSRAKDSSFLNPDDRKHFRNKSQLDVLAQQN